VSGYTIGEIAVWLLLAAALGFVLGWLVRELVLRTRPASAPVPEPKPEPVPKPEPEPVPEPAPAPKPEPEPAPKPEPEPEPAPIVPGPHPGSALPLADGAAPSPDYVVKVSRGSKIFHAPSSPAYARTTAAIWFTGPEAAEAAGFRRPKNG
jgi:outer membrane biosynthesis protein TonB